MTREERMEKALRRIVEYPRLPARGDADVDGWMRGWNDALTEARAALSPPADAPRDEECPDCNDGIETRPFSVPHEVPCSTCNGTMRVLSPPAAAPRCGHRNVAKEPAKGRRVCRDCGMVAPDVRPEGTPKWQPADAPRDDAPRCGCNPTRTPSGTGWVHHGNCPAPAEEYARKGSYP